MTFEYEIEDIDYDNGYGVQNGTLIVECEPIWEDCRFDAHNGIGNLQTYGGYAVTGAKVLGATLYLIGNNGQDIGEIEFPDYEALNEFKWLEEYLVNELNEENEI